ncbi:hypothetical protein GS531_24345 [Rhodococcus hoagii]|nr:hypothetical protein [Prescottella equi]
MGLALPENYETTAAPTLPIESLADLPLVAGGRGTVVREELERVCGHHGFAPRVMVEVEHEHNVHLLVARGPAAASSPSRRRVSPNVVASGSRERHPSWDVTSGWCSARLPFPGCARLRHVRHRVR